MADKPFKVLQLNTQKKQGTMHSLMNDDEFETFGALLISEPNAWRNQDGVMISSPRAHQVVLISSVYIQCADQEALQSAIQHISEAVALAKLRFPQLELIIAGDFNRHDTLWGGAAVRGRMNQLSASDVLS